MADSVQTASFGAILRQHRLRTGLTQSALAERAGVSVRALQYLETSAGQPQRETTRRLAEALGLTAEQRVLFDRASAPAPRARASSVQRGPPVEARDALQKWRANDVVTSPDGLSGEYKQVTVLVADVSGLADSTQSFEPNLADRLLGEIIPLLIDVVHRYNGTVNRAGGDGVTALFGAPLAREDDAVRACHAALAMHEAFRREAERVSEAWGIKLVLRVGLDSGEVVLRTASNDLYREYTAVGPSVRVATRIGQLAEADNVTVVSPETARLAEGYVCVRPVRSISAVDATTPLEVLEVVGVQPAQTRFQRIVGMRQLTRFVGRDAEFNALLAALSRVRDGHGQIVALVGEPGVGKSRIVWELSRTFSTHGWLVLESGSPAYATATSYTPIVDLLKRYCRIEPRDDAFAIREKIRDKIQALDASLYPTLPALLTLLDVPPGDAGWEALDATQRRRETLDALKRLFLRESREHPLILVFEDLHWIDEETQALLDTLADSLPTARILLLVNYRPEYRHEWGSKTYYTQLTVSPLGQRYAEDLLTELLGNEAALEPLKVVLTERTEGNPLFLEESVRSLVETDLIVGERGAYRLAHPIRNLRVPSTVRAVLAARIDRLPMEQRRLLQTAAVIGKDVPVVLLRVVAECDEHEFQKCLLALKAAELLYEAGLSPEPACTFKHALTHEVAYRSVLQQRRQELHGRVVTAIEQLYHDRLGEHVERLARHATGAEAWEKAATYGHQAGRRAMARSATREAVKYLEQAVSAVDRLPASHDRSQRAIDLRFELRAALRQNDDEERAIQRLWEAQALAEDIGDQRRLAWADAHLASTLWMTGAYVQAIRLARRSASVADDLGGVTVQNQAYCSIALPLWALGRYRDAADLFRRALSFLPEERLGVRSAEQAHVGGVMTLANLAWVLAELGAFDEARSYEQQAIHLAEESSSAITLVSVYNRTGSVALRQGDVARIVDRLERGVEFCRTHEQWFILPFAIGKLGAAYVAIGRVREAIPLLEEVAERTRSGRALAEGSQGLVALGEAYLADGRPVEALRVAEEAFEGAQRRHERGNEAWACHLLGEIVARRESPNADKAEPQYAAALMRAKDLGMRPLEARCHLGLGKLYRRIGRLAEAQTSLMTAIAMLREMGMVSWLQEAENELAKAGESAPVDDDAKRYGNHF